MKTGQTSALKVFALVFAFFWLIMILFRVALWIYASPAMPEPLGADAWKAFYIGCKFDARITALLTIPLGLILSIPWLATRLHKIAKWLALAYAPVFAGLIVIYSIDFGFYAYLGNRLSSLIFDLLNDLEIAVDMVMQSYPMPLIFAAAFVGTVLWTLGFYFIIRKPVRPAKTRLRQTGVFAVMLLITVLAIFGQINTSFMPLRWSHAFFTTNEAIIALGLNPLQSLYDTHDSSSDGFSLEKARQAYPRMAEFLLVDQPDQAKLNYKRYRAGRPDDGHKPPPNVVIIVMESLAYPKSSFAPGQLDPTPHVRELAAQSALFHRFFCNSRTTARSIFSLMTGLPDVNEGNTGSRNPLVVDQRVVGNEFDGYRKYYMIGGNTGWANIRAVLAQNIKGLTIIEDSDWKSPRVDVWGVSDYDLFTEAHEVLKNQDQPFLAVIQTASYHRPYTIPETPGFSSQPASDDDLALYGFESQHEYDSMRYSDFALGHFMSLAKSAAYYDNTIFFVFGDHGLNDPSQNMPAGYMAANLAPWHIPLVIHAAPGLGLIEAGFESDTPVSEIDIFPTAAGLAGIAYNNWTLGRDIFDRRYDHSRAVFISGDRGAPMRLISGDYVYYNNMIGKRALFKIDSPDRQDLSAQEPELFARLEGLASDFDATLRYLLFNNKKDDRRNVR